MASSGIIFVQCIFVTLYFLQVVKVESVKFTTDKPEDYPAFDDAYLKKLANHKFPVEEPSDYPIKNDCGTDAAGRFCCTETTYTKPYVLALQDNVEKYVVQTDFFQQVIKQTRCDSERNTGGCFKDFIHGTTERSLEGSCKTNKGSTSVLVLNKVTNKREWLSIEIDVSCSCNISQK